MTKINVHHIPETIEFGSLEIGEFFLHRDRIFLKVNIEERFIRGICIEGDVVAPIDDPHVKVIRIQKIDINYDI